MCGGKLKNLLQQLSAKLEANASSSPYFVGDSLTIADLQVGMDDMFTYVTIFIVRVG